MHESEQERLGGAAAPEPKMAWLKPEVDKLIAGGAEGSADIATDGIDIPS